MRGDVDIAVGHVPSPWKVRTAPDSSMRPGHNVVNVFGLTLVNVNDENVTGQTGGNDGTPRGVEPVRTPSDRMA